jgi:tight adherence protein B
MITLLAALGVVGFVCVMYKLRDQYFMKKRTRRVSQKYEKVSSSAGEGIQYGKYRLSAFEYAGCLAVGGAAGFGVGYLFYHHLIAGLICSAAGLYMPKWRVQARIKKRREELGRQFKQSLQALVSSLTAGRSVENAFAASVQDLRLLYSDPNTYIIVEFERIDRKIANGETVESALADLASRSGLEELLQFTDVFATCKRTGGNLAEVMRRTAQLIGEKMEIRQEIHVMLAQKRFESKVLGAAPIAVIALLYGSSPDYMAPLYGNPAGAVIMTFCLAVFSLCWRMTGKLMDVKV